MKIVSTLLLAGLIPAFAIAADNAASTTNTAPASSAPAAQSAPAAKESNTAPASTAVQKQDVAEQSGFSKGSVMRSIFTSDIKDREPTDKINNTSDEKVFYFTELRDMNGQTATHRWEHDGKVISEMKFNVGGNRWRVWSSKNFLPQSSGDWKVSVLNGAGEVISEEVLKVGGADASASDKTAPAKASIPTSDIQAAPAKAAQ